MRKFDLTNSQVAIARLNRQLVSFDNQPASIVAIQSGSELADVLNICQPLYFKDDQVDLFPNYLITLEK